METNTLKAHLRKKKRILRIRNKISGTQEKPRLSVTKSNKYFSVQVVDDVKGLTLVSATTASKEIKEKNKGSKKLELAKKLGSIVAEKCLEAGITKAVLDRRGSRYHGVIAAFADAAREKGLQF